MLAAGAGGRHLGAAPDTAAAAGAILGPGRSRGGAGAAMFVWGAVLGGGKRRAGRGCLCRLTVSTRDPQQRSPAALGQTWRVKRQYSFCGARCGGFFFKEQGKKEMRHEARRVLLLEVVEMPAMQSLVSGVGVPP